MMQSLKRNWNVFSKLTWSVWQSLTRALKILKNFHFNGLFLTKIYNAWAQNKYRGVMFDVFEDSCEIQGKPTCAFKNDMRNLENFHSLKDSNFILERKMAELNKNKKLETTRTTRCSIKTLFYLGNKWITQLTKILTNVLLKFSEAITKLPNLHIFWGHDGCFWKINLRILWNHIIKKFQVKHGQCDIIIFSKTLSFERSSQLKYLCWKQGSFLLIGFGIYLQIFHRTPCPAVLICEGA